jgi:glycine/D-amino acid oxidase-like deaminating enzyme/nitrite reductase/ring-hydroxylating ferredoxin subunit
MKDPMAHSGKTSSVWMSESLDVPSPLESDIETDVCIVGAGITGLSTAYQLSREGKRTVVIDDSPLAAGETERTTAHLSYALDDRLSILEELHGLENARLAVQSHKAAIDEIEATVSREGIDCDFARLDGYLFPPPGGSLELLQRDLDAARRIGLSDVQFMDRAPIPGFDTGRCLLFPRQGQFHPLKYLQGLKRAIERNGGQLFSGTRAVTFEGGTPARVGTENGRTITCRGIVVATNTPVNDRYKIHSKQAPYRTYAIGLEIPRGAVPSALYWDTAQDAESEKAEPMSASYHYVRLQPVPGPDREILIVGGEDHKTGDADDADKRWRHLELWTRKRFPEAGEVSFRWSGQVMEPVDGLAYIGRNPGDEHNVFIATGESGHGMTHGTIAGMLIRDMVFSRPNAWEMVYEPSRKTARSGVVYARENLDVVKKYSEFVTGGDVRSVEDIRADSGAIIRRGISKVAVYKDPEGRLHELSAVCPHLKCIVHWNSAERSWDCPCHGSRFTRYGDVLNGPAMTGLKKIEETAQERRKAA